MRDQGVLEKLNDEDQETKFKEEVNRLAPYIEGGAIPIMLKLNTQQNTYIFARTFIFKGNKDYRELYIKENE